MAIQVIDIPPHQDMSLDSIRADSVSDADPLALDEGFWHLPPLRATISQPRAREPAHDAATASLSRSEPVSAD